MADLVPVTGLSPSLTSQTVGDKRPFDKISATKISDGAGNEANTAALIASMTGPRTPTAHKTSHATGGADALAAADIGAAAATHASTHAASGGDPITLPSASNTAAGIIRIATTTEAEAGTATGVAVTPAQLRGHIATFSATITGDGTTTDWPVNHNLNAASLVWTVIDVSTGGAVVMAAQKASANQLVLSTSTAIASGKQYLVSIVGF